MPASSSSARRAAAQPAAHLHRLDGVPKLVHQVQRPLISCIHLLGPPCLLLALALAPAGTNITRPLHGHICGQAQHGGTWSDQSFGRCRCAPACQPSAASSAPAGRGGPGA
jgi:hypothetical protein